jgi:hypothetical protein
MHSTYLVLAFETDGEDIVACLDERPIVSVDVTIIDGRSHVTQKTGVTPIDDCLCQTVTLPSNGLNKRLQYD